MVVLVNWWLPVRVVKWLDYVDIYQDLFQEAFAFSRWADDG
jgi:hypothetical protein